MLTGIQKLHPSHFSKNRIWSSILKLILKSYCNKNKDIHYTLLRDTPHLSLTWSLWKDDICFATFFVWQAELKERCTQQKAELLSVVLSNHHSKAKNIIWSPSSSLFPTHTHTHAHAHTHTHTHKLSQGVLILQYDVNWKQQETEEWEKLQKCNVWLRTDWFGTPIKTMKWLHTSSSYQHTNTQNTHRNTITRFLCLVRKATLNYWLRLKHIKFIIWRWKRICVLARQPGKSTSVRPVTTAYLAWGGF